MFVHPLMRWLLLYHSVIMGAQGIIHFLTRGSIFRIPVDSVIKALISLFIDPVITGLGPAGPHLLSTVVLLLLDHIHSFEKPVPLNSTPINVILWELTGVLIGMKNCIQSTCLRGNDSTRSLTKQSCKCLPVDGILHLNVSLS